MKLRTDEFRARLADARAQWSDDERVVRRYIDPLSEYWAVRDGGLGLIDRSDRETLVISGPDTITWLQGLITADLMTLEREGSGLRSSMVNQVGKAIADIRVLHIPELLLLDFTHGNLERGDILHHLNRHIIMEKVHVEDRTPHAARLTLTGRLAAHTLDRVGFFERPIESIDALYEGTWGKIKGRGVTVQRIALTGEPTFDITCARGETDAIWEAIFSSNDQVRPVGHDALELLRLEAGVVEFDGAREYHNKIIPIEANLNDTISYEKGCYLGQEVIHRLDTRGRPAKMLRALIPSGDPVPFAEGMTCLFNGKKVGKIVRASVAPTQDDLPFGWAYIKRAAYEQGTTLEVHGEHDDEVYHAHVTTIEDVLVP